MVVISDAVSSVVVVNSVVVVSSSVVEVVDTVDAESLLALQ